MHRIVRHILLPVLVCVCFFAVAFTPVEVLGCRNRGLLALAIAGGSGLGALGTAIVGLQRRVQRDAVAPWWAVSTLILTVPVVGMILLA
ncbi:MAG: hypothetical protein MUE60_16835 [Candidatus Eisenbacteria bacterium]|jgi:hypothetical protein|nr:hypothetical protein [Candidatus Eisenbacteria bacterium]